MTFLRLTNMIHMPVTAHERDIRNSFGVTIAIATSPLDAECIARLINLGHEPAKQLEADHDALPSEDHTGAK